MYFRPPQAASSSASHWVYSSTQCHSATIDVLQGALRVLVVSGTSGSEYLFVVAAVAFAVRGNAGVLSLNVALRVRFFGKIFFVSPQGTVLSHKRKVQGKAMFLRPIFHWKTLFSLYLHEFRSDSKKKKGLIRLLMADIKHQTTWLFGFIVVVIFFVSVKLLIFV